MLCADFECAPDVVAVMGRTGGLRGRFVLENVFAGKAIVGAEPFLTLTSKDGLTALEQAGSRRILPGDPFEALRLVLGRYAGEPVPDVPFAGGAVGYFSYDLGRVIERVPVIAQEDVPTPDYCLGFYDSALIIDSARAKCTAVSWSGDKRAVDLWREIARDAAEVSQGGYSVRRGSPRPAGRGSTKSADAFSGIRSNFTPAGYLRAIERVKQYIAAGDCYQVNLSQRFDAELSSQPWKLYEALRRINPAPHSCFIEIGEPALVSASPESFLSYDPATRIVITRPIKGTRPRGASAEEDARLAAELAASEKDRAENLMIVDMERNDLGRVARYGSVRVPKLWEIEAHPNVFQMVSTVEAELAEDRDQIDLLRAAFPGGSITGAPKVRAMEIIEELEPHRRGIYTGSAGFIDFGGRMELNIVIRSFVVHSGRVYFHAGGGIVADSVPEMEYQETLDKVSGLVAALDEVRRQDG
ncbi:MAG: aminodeoxychorismate synthase component I [Armatimonadota bacterium]